MLEQMWVMSLGKEPGQKEKPGWTCTLKARRSDQSILKEINPEYSPEGLMLKLKLQYYGHLRLRAEKEPTHWKRPWCWERLRAKEGGDRGWDGWMASLTQWTWVWVNLGIGDGQGGLACCDSWGRKESDTTEWLNWTENFVKNNTDKHYF